MSMLGRSKHCNTGRWRRRLAASLAFAAGILVSAANVDAHDPGGGVDYYSQLSCNQLWYERNAIYAQYGYCFKSQRAISTFGRACHPPYGKLPSNLQHVVSDIQAWERRRGCR